ncbi:hypothetical protein OIU78_016448 [Salix suchowensis]|nr:hypothetical protein OIU78_016448 [Salix suchowensis]
MIMKCFCCDREEEEEPKTSKNSSSSREYPWKIYPLKEILHATNNFSDDNKIGEGGFGSVYWGQTSTGTEIAVKRLKAMSAKAEMEFALEVEILGRLDSPSAWPNRRGLRARLGPEDEHNDRIRRGNRVLAP